MADKKVPPKPSTTGRATSVPPAKKTYTPANEEVWSDDTQGAVDRYLGGDADHDRRGGGH